MIDQIPAHSPPLDYAGPARRRRRVSTHVIASFSIAVACVGLIVNGMISRSFLDKVPSDSAAAALAAQAAAKEAAAEAAELAAEQQAQANPPRGLTADEATHVIESTEWVCGAMSDAQRATLRSILCADGQRIIDPSIPIETCHWGRDNRLVFDKPRQQLLTAKMMRNPLLSIQVIHRQSDSDRPTISSISIKPDGVLMYKEIYSPAGRDIQSLQETSHEMSDWGLSRSAMRDQSAAQEALASSWAGLVAGGCAALLSAMLFLAGMLLLSGNSAAGIRLHRIYVAAKLVVVLVSAFAFVAAVSSRRAPGSLFSSEIAAVAAIIFAAIGCVHPIFLLLALPELMPTNTSRNSIP
jgi:hypothetical protein